MPCSHATYLEAFHALNSIADVNRLRDAGHLGLDHDALLSILSRKVVDQTKVTIGRHRRPEVCQAYMKRFYDGETLLSIANDICLPPSMLARVILEQHLGLKKGKEVGKYIKSPGLIDDPRLRKSVTEAVDGDIYYGPRGDAFARCRPRPTVGDGMFGWRGHQHQETWNVLKQTLRSRGIPFLTEDELRARDEARTPDVLFPVPVCVRGRQIHWIDSKATFGSVASHAEYHATQYSAYLHRFDGGLVIYWFGFDESIDNDPRVLLLDRFPTTDCELMSHFAIASHAFAPILSTNETLAEDVIDAADDGVMLAAAGAR